MFCLKLLTKGRILINLKGVDTEHHGGVGVIPASYAGRIRVQIWTQRLAI